MSKFDDGVRIYSIDENQQELTVYLGDLREFHNEYKKLKKENKRLQQKLMILSVKPCKPTDSEILQQRIDKAIEYIENHKRETSSHFNGKEYVYINYDLVCEPNDLLEILKGEPNNE